MSLITDHDPAECRECIFERQDWEIIRDNGISPEAVDARARLWLRIVEIVDRPRGIERLQHTFFLGIAKEHRDSAYQGASPEQYLRYIAGDLSPDEERLLKADGPTSLQSNETSNNKAGGLIAGITLLLAGALFLVSARAENRGEIT
jgi:hypothetical protein